MPGRSGANRFCEAVYEISQEQHIPGITVGNEMTAGTLHRLTAFSATPDGGNPAGVWVGEAIPDAVTMQRIASEVGFSETAFIAPRSGFERTIRFYSSEAEVLFCGHATIAAGVFLGETSGDGRYAMQTAVGEVPVDVAVRNGAREASFMSVEPKHAPVPGMLLEESLSAIHWKREDLDPSIPPVRAYAGVWHLILAAATRERLDELNYDFERLKNIMLGDGLTTLQLVWRESPDVFYARNPFPVGGVVEDPATGAAAAALGGYLRSSGMIQAPGSITIRQGEAIGRPSRITVGIPANGGIVITGQAVRLPV